METLQLQADQIDQAVYLISQGQLVAFPTETVYGLGAPVFCAEMVRKIFIAKGRPSDNPLIAHISSLSQVRDLAREIPPIFDRLAEVFFPGPLTVVLQRHPQVPAIVSAGLDTIALRMPNHPLALKLIEGVKQPLVAPSANLSGRPSPTESSHVLEDLEGKIGAVLDGGRTQYGLESTVISLLGEHPVLLRPGAITADQISEVLGCPVLTPLAAQENRILSPGMKYRHYAPRAAVRLFETSSDCLQKISEVDKHKLLIISRNRISQEVDYHPLSPRELYAALRYADQMGYEEIFLYCDPVVLADTALMNRIRRMMEPHEAC